MSDLVQNQRFIAEFSSLAAIAQFVNGCCGRWHLSEEATFAVRLAVEEAATNIIEHAYEGSGESLEVRCWVEGQDFVVELHDWGKQFNPNDIAAPDTSARLSDRSAGGLGIHFMRQLMDEVHFSFASDGNRVLMIKRNVAI